MEKNEQVKIKVKTVEEMGNELRKACNGTSCNQCPLIDYDYDCDSLFDASADKDTVVKAYHERFSSPIVEYLHEEVARQLQEEFNSDKRAKADYGKEQRMTSAENRLHQAEEQLGFKINIPQYQVAKADEGKAPISLVPMEIVWAIAWIRKYGNEKYGDPDNWKTVEPERYRDALMRHILHYISDPKSVDEESGYPHLWHAACNMAFLMNMDYVGMCHYDFAVEKSKWEKIGKEAVENLISSPSERKTHDR